MPEKQGDSGWFRNRKSGVLPAMPIARNISWRKACNRIRNPDSAQKVQYSDAIVRDSHPLSRKMPQVGRHFGRWIFKRSRLSEKAEFEKSCSSALPLSHGGVACLAATCYSDTIPPQDRFAALRRIFYVVMIGEVEPRRLATGQSPRIKIQRADRSCLQAGLGFGQSKHFSGTFSSVLCISISTTALKSPFVSSKTRSCSSAEVPRSRMV
jgi:hypothetical protein